MRSICPRPGCGELYERGPRQHACDDHHAEASRADAARRNARPRRAVYRDPRWPGLRAACLERDRFTCVDCGRHELEFAVNECLLADHHRGTTQAIAAGVALELDELATRCSTCSGRRDGARAHGGEVRGASPQSTPPLPLRAFRRIADETTPANVPFVL